ncbi:MAG: barstar family protein [Planctomycetes bacterium]|nr:barstar family protein [Planctomycetota bacterium]
MFHFYSPPDNLAEADPAAHVGTVPAGISGTKQLLEAVGKALAFPPFSGKNFDAFWDCIRDLSPALPHRIVLSHQDLPLFSPSEQAVYIELLRDATLYWRIHGGEHRFECWFPICAMEQVCRLVHELPPPEPEGWNAVES